MVDCQVLQWRGLIYTEFAHSLHHFDPFAHSPERENLQIDESIPFSSAFWAHMRWTVHKAV